jgi:hypothetical protein
MLIDGYGTDVQTQQSLRVDKVDFFSISPFLPGWLVTWLVIKYGHHLWLTLGFKLWMGHDEFDY